MDQPDRICPRTVFDSLRSAEAATIIKAMGWSVPDVPNTQRHRVMRALFAEFEPTALHRQMVSTLKRSRNLAPLSDLVDHLPESLHAAALSIPMQRSEHGRLVNAIATPLCATASWA
jgi:hypothetical protein